MKINNSFWHFGALIVILLIIPYTSVAQSGKDYHRMYLSGQDAASAVSWEFKVTDGRKSGQWNTIPVPSNWELHGFGNYNYGHDHANPERELANEHGLYRYRFSVPQDWKGKEIRIVFDGSMTDTRVSINGKQAGELHQGAFYRFRYDITKLLSYGDENLLEVDVAKHSANASVNRAERQADFWIFGGIYRPVFLEVLPNYHFTRLAIDAKHTGIFRSLVKLNKPLNGAGVRISLKNQDGLTLSRIAEIPHKKSLNEDESSRLCCEN